MLNVQAWDTFEHLLYTLSRSSRAFPSSAGYALCREQRQWWFVCQSHQGATEDLLQKHAEIVAWKTVSVRYNSSKLWRCTLSIPIYVCVLLWTHTPVVKTSSLARVGQARLVRVCKPGVHKSRSSRVLCFISHVSCQDGLCQSTSNAVTAPEGGINADRAPRWG